MMDRTTLRGARARARLLSTLLLASAACADMHTTASRDGAVGKQASDGAVAVDPRDAAGVSDATRPPVADASDAASTSADTGVSVSDAAVVPSADGSTQGSRAPVSLGAAARFVVLAKTAISNVPTSAISGDVGISPAAATYVTGFSYTRAGSAWTAPEVTGSIFAADNDAPTPINLTTAVSDMETAYVDAAGRTTPDFSELGTGAIGGRTLSPGLYKWSSSVSVSTQLVLAGGPSDVWIFQIAGGLTVAANTSMTLSGGARASNVFWQVASAVDFGAGAHGEGTILCMTSINLQTGASLNGRLLAQSAVHIGMSTLTKQ